jgi:hypothetical protein
VIGEALRVIDIARTVVRDVPYRDTVETKIPLLQRVSRFSESGYPSPLSPRRYRPTGVAAC